MTFKTWHKCNLRIWVADMDVSVDIHGIVVETPCRIFNKLFFTICFHSGIDDGLADSK